MRVSWYKLAFPGSLDADAVVHFVRTSRSSAPDMAS